jgi:hypothetical protein
MRPTVRKDELLTILRGNQSRHRAVFEAALEGFHKEAQRQLNSTVKAIRNGSRRTVYVRLEAPQDHTRDYKRVIRMVEMHQGDTITLSEDDAAQYIEDDWGWKRAWLQNSSSYAAAAVAACYDAEE